MPSPQDHATRLDAYRAWLTANAIDPNTVPINGDITIVDNPDRTRSIVYEAFELDADGRKQLNERRDGAAIRTCSTALIVDPPTWWKPYEKPTRDQLLAFLDEIQKLGTAFEYEATAVGMAEPAREALRDAARRIRSALPQPSGSPR